MKILLFTIILLQFGCATKNPDYKTLNESLQDKQAAGNSEKEITDPNAVYPLHDENKVAPGYSFRLSHPNDKDLSGSYKVNFEGLLHLPYKIKIDTKDKTVSEVTAKVQEAYRPFFRADSPPVSFTIAERKYWVEIGGLVNKSGKYLVNANTSFDELVAMAQGISSEAKTEYMTAKITQGTKVFEVDLNQYYKNGDATRFPHWQGGDFVFIKKLGGDSTLSPQMIKVMGDVRTPSDVAYIEGADLYYYVLKAGGQNNTVDMYKYEIVRTIDGKKQAIVFDPSEVDTIPVLHAGDVLTLYPYRETATERFLRNLSYLGTIITAAAVLLIAL